MFNCEIYTKFTSLRRQEYYTRIVLILGQLSKMNINILCQGLLFRSCSLMNYFNIVEVIFPVKCRFVIARGCNLYSLVLAFSAALAIWIVTMTAMIVTITA